MTRFRVDLDYTDDIIRVGADMPSITVRQSGSSQRGCVRALLVMLLSS